MKAKLTTRFGVGSSYSWCVCRYVKLVKLYLKLIIYNHLEGYKVKTITLIMKKAFFSVIVIFAALFWTSCTKPDNNPSSSTSLKFSVVVNVGNPVSSATISLYQSQTDYTNNTNVVSTQATDNNGMATFSSLSGIVYYYTILRSSDCSSNVTATNHTANALTSGTSNTISVVVDQVGQMNFVNSSSNPYYVYINGALWNTVNGMSTQSAYANVGAYAIEAKQVSGYAVYPTDEKFSVNVTACSNTNVPFP